MGDGEFREEQIKGLRSAVYLNLLSIWQLCMMSQNGHRDKMSIRQTQGVANMACVLAENVLGVHKY